jgi:hypothetical protein
MREFKKIAPIENEIESLRLRSELDGRGIPYAMRSYHDSAYDGLFQFSAGWGRVEAPVEYKDEILQILEVIRQMHVQETEAADEQTGNKA